MSNQKIIILGISVVAAIFSLTNFIPDSFSQKTDEAKSDKPLLLSPSKIPPIDNRTLPSTAQSALSTNPDEEGTTKPLIDKFSPGLTQQQVNNEIAKLEQKQKARILDTPINSYQATVTFNKVIVHDDSETWAGDGEFDITAYVQGKKISLTDASRPSGSGGLWDVSDGEVVPFPAGTKVDVTLPKGIPLSLIVVGTEVDGCGRAELPEDLQNLVGATIVNWIASNVPFGNLIIDFLPIKDWLSDLANSIHCLIRPNDNIGSIVKVYESPQLGAGNHVERSDAQRDYSLDYTITVKQPIVTKFGQTPLGTLFR